MTRRKEKNQEKLAGLPEAGPLVDKATELLDAREVLEKAKLKSDTIKAELVQLFIDEGKTSIKVEGCTIFYSHLEKDQIKVKQAE